MNKWKAWTVVLLLISIMSLLFAISVYKKQKRYIEEDMKQFIDEINNSISKSKVEIDNIILNNEEIHIEFEDIRRLITHHRDLDRNIFGFKKKSRFINSELEKGFQQLWDNYNYNEQINAGDIELYYDQLSERVNSIEYILLNNNDVNMFQEILNFYYTIRKDINNLIAE
ncbi:hypothetical protein [Tissierella sp. Yu-01]|uniref:hypothetical protein n=1 Tax=Tissierella sp. Yu-01 TaxID=3035694 RepID=UPI00240D7136|nr:hypothetical protein [Tissierella sp. Yu-01]WFA08777.1 hypothetical protein P3962_13780 [Tissierella sp. Yu-01]